MGNVLGPMSACPRAGGCPRVDALGLMGAHSGVRDRRFKVDKRSRVDRRSLQGLRTVLCSQAFYGSAFLGGESRCLSLTSRKLWAR